jgi:hypothetical protein
VEEARLTHDAPSLGPKRRPPALPVWNGLGSGPLHRSHAPGSSAARWESFVTWTRLKEASVFVTNMFLGEGRGQFLAVVGNMWLSRKNRAPTSRFLCESWAGEWECKIILWKEIEM